MRGSCNNKLFKIFEGTDLKIKGTAVITIPFVYSCLTVVNGRFVLFFCHFFR